MHEGMALNRANWDERVAVHLRSAFYNVDGFRRGETDLGPIEAAEIGDVAGLRVAHLQCHFGLDTMYLARRGARVTGLDFSANAIAAARALAAETGSIAEFVEGDVYDAPRLLGAGLYDLVFTSWGTILWLPDIAGWARVVAALLKPGGRLYFLDDHPAARALDQRGADAPVVPTYAYFNDSPFEFDAQGSYADRDAAFTHTRSVEWMHPLGAIVGALLAAGLRLTALREHDATAWQMWPCLVRGEDELWRMPADGPNLPLSLTIEAVKG
ncbi:class I SAM-dependent methyltransferase [Inquilinus limosus]|uniref:class I SAM-dependent methyltransferase n=1 Tax=Inquilinus limosus TaxID=171674 RepID=UPI003F14D07D